MAQWVKNPPAMQKMLVQSLGQEYPLEKGMATHYHSLAWWITCTEEPGRLQSMGLQTVGHNWPTNTFTFPWKNYLAWRFLSSLSLLFVIKSCLTLWPPWTVAHHALPSMEFSRQEYWSWQPFPFPGDLHDPGIKPKSPALQAASLPSELPRKPLTSK